MLINILWRSIMITCILKINDVFIWFRIQKIEVTLPSSSYLQFLPWRDSVGCVCPRLSLVYSSKSKHLSFILPKQQTIFYCLPHFKKITWTNVIGFTKDKKLQSVTSGGRRFEWSEVGVLNNMKTHF